MGILTTVSNSEAVSPGVQAQLDGLLGELGEAFSVDHLAGTRDAEQNGAQPTGQHRKSWKIHQLTRGHRFSTDDLMTAWVAAQEAAGLRGRQEQLDLGAGIGSVGLLTQWRLGQLAPETDWRLTMVEAQEVSHKLARATILLNGLEDRVTPRLGDLRNTNLDRIFPLVTGSPPYIPLGKGIASKHPQKAACRMELRGSIFDYAQAAARHLSEDGTFVVCFAGQDPRGEQALSAAGLVLHRRMDVLFRAHLEPTICLLVARKTPCAQPVRERFTIRDHQGTWTPEYLQMRLEMGADPDSLRTRPVSPDTFPEAVQNTHGG